MDLRVYYQKIRQMEAEMADAAVVIVSRETADGGRGGMKTEVTRAVAARLIVEEKADLATPEEAEAFRSVVRKRSGRGSEMLLTDGGPNGTVDLQVYESAILDVANTEGIDLDVKLGLATEEISEMVLDILLDHTRSTDPLANARRIARGVGRGGDAADEALARAAHAGGDLPGRVQQSAERPVSGEVGANTRPLARDAQEHTLQVRDRPRVESDSTGAGAGVRIGGGDRCRRRFTTCR